MDEDLKKSMEKTCHELGINITTAITMFAKKMTREQRIPFSVSINNPVNYLTVGTEQKPPIDMEKSEEK